VHEDDPCVPINPYGQSKLVGEWLARAAGAAWGLRQVSLRYFNVAGAGWADLADSGQTNLIPTVVECMARHQPVPVFGSDYATPDGTCVRDYIHVLDLARAHIDALAYLQRHERPYDVFNIGTGSGASVLEVLRVAARVSSSGVGSSLEPRRMGDPASLVAMSDRASDVLGWSAKQGLDAIIASARVAASYRAQTDVN
jgi:UDP-glucose 4-epimerase